MGFHTQTPGQSGLPHTLPRVLTGATSRAQRDTVSEGGNHSSDPLAAATNKSGTIKNQGQGPGGSTVSWESVHFTDQRASGAATQGHFTHPLQINLTRLDTWSP